MHLPDAMKTIGAIAGLSCGVWTPAPWLHADAPYTIASATLAPLNTAISIAGGDGSHERPVVADAKSDSNPSWSQDRQSVLFTSRRHGSADIYRVRVDGTDLERLTDDIAFDDQAVMAPDGRRIAFVSSRTGQADIWQLDLATRRVRNHRASRRRLSVRILTGRGMDRLHIRPRFGWCSPAHRLSVRALQSTQIYVMRADGLDVRRVTVGETTVGGASWPKDHHAAANVNQVPNEKRRAGSRNHTWMNDVEAPPRQRRAIVSGDRMAFGYHLITLFGVRDFQRYVAELVENAPQPGHA